MPGVIYQFSWRPNIWSEFYPQAKETRQYIQNSAKASGFYRFMRFKHEITRAVWTASEAKWTLTVNNIESRETFDDRVDVFLEFNGPVKYMSAESSHPYLTANLRPAPQRSLCLA